jgi:cytochrome c-type biogenesis protein CcmH/NrfG
MAGKNTRKRLFLLASLAMFGGSSIIGGLKLYTTAAPEPEPAEALVTVSLKEQASSYEAVLQREPQNQTALEGLVNTRLQMQDAKGATATLEKLIQLHPDRSDYQTLLAEIKKLQAK